MTIKELRQILEEKIEEHEESLDLLRGTQNPQVIKIYNQTLGEHKVLTAIQQAIMGNSVFLNIL